MRPIRILLPFIAGLLTIGSIIVDADEGQNQIARRYFEELLNQGRLEIADEILTSDVRFSNPPTTLNGREEFKKVVVTLRKAFPDLRFDIADEIAEGNKVVTRWTMTGTQRAEFMGRPATNKRMSVSGIEIFHVIDGRIQQVWVNMDSMGLAQQLGWFGAPDQQPK